MTTGTLRSQAALARRKRWLFRLTALGLAFVVLELKRGNDLLATAVALADLAERE